MPSLWYSEQIMNETPVFTEISERREAADEARVRQILVELFRKEFATELSRDAAEDLRLYQQWVDGVIHPLHRVWLMSDVASSGESAERGTVAHGKDGVAMTFPIDISEVDKVMAEVRIGIASKDNDGMQGVVDYNSFRPALDRRLGRTVEFDYVSWSSDAIDAYEMATASTTLRLGHKKYKGVGGMTIYTVSRREIEQVRDKYEAQLMSRTKIRRIEVGFAGSTQKLTISQPTDALSQGKQSGTESHMLEKMVATLSPNDRRELLAGTYAPEFFRARMRDIAQAPAIFVELERERAVRYFLLQRIQDSDFFKRNARPWDPIQDAPYKDGATIGLQDSVPPAPQDATGNKEPRYRVVDRTRGDAFPPN